MDSVAGTPTVARSSSTAAVVRKTPRCSRAEWPPPVGSTALSFSGRQEVKVPLGLTATIVAGSRPLRR